ncbi:Putative aspartate/glutamate/uridylate kinase, aspartate kinase, ACT domain, CASTOR, ACT [Colletotrichum destructivum]|uniref:Aspartate kinase FUB3 n=1 Tax=Colletotrichum destructivum TaxID=34406 RepID=A0AAX4ITC1_9PEZI|nr:Putative aspartate/glutamate/uridylate kinase, aspartate kinase, ACT domain, CASTOR, ACT [Colletotrichum destructivum]
MEAVGDNKPWLVQKYGGTSLGKLLDPICSKIIPSHQRDYNLVVVCSALSGSTKASGTTSLLLECVSHAEAGLSAQAQLNRNIDAIRDTHVRLLEKHLVNSNGTRSDLCRDIFDTTKAVIFKECESLRGFLLAAQIIGELSPRARDRVISLGEKLACRVVTAFLGSKDVHAETVVLEDVIETVFGSSVFDQKAALGSLGPRFYHLVADEIAKRIRGCGDCVPVVTGFFGIMPDSLLKNVGRGYSDLCAAMCAVGTGAVELQIWKEVDGIFTADPRKVPSARLLSTVTPEEATELTYYGSEVIHPLTMDQIRCANIPLRLKNVFNPTGRGTIIYPTPRTTPQTTPPLTPRKALMTPPISTTGEEKRDEKIDDVEVKPEPRPVTLPTIDFMLGNGYHGERQERRRPTAVTAKDDILLVNVACNRNTKSQGFLSGVFERLEDVGFKADLVTTSERSVSLACQLAEDGPSRHQRLRAELEKFGKVIITENMSIVTVVGHKMRNMVGVSAEIMAALASAKINIFMVSQGASEINVSLVVRAEDAVLALNMIHSKVLRIPTHWEQENNFIKGAEARRRRRRRHPTAAPELLLDPPLPPSHRPPPEKHASWYRLPLTHAPRSVALLIRRKRAAHDDGGAYGVGGPGPLRDGVYGSIEGRAKRKREV